MKSIATVALLLPSIVTSFTASFTTCPATLPVPTLLFKAPLVHPSSHLVHQHLQRDTTAKDTSSSTALSMTMSPLVATSSSVSTFCAVQYISSLFDAFVIGAPIWFFYIQAPALKTYMQRAYGTTKKQNDAITKGRKRSHFIPIMMKLTEELFGSSTKGLGPFTAASVISFMLTILHSGFTGNVSIYDPSLRVTAIGALSAIVARFFVIPKALAAGRASLLNPENSDEQSAKSFAIDGGDKGRKSGTRFWHLSTVLLTHVMVVSAASHLWILQH